MTKKLILILSLFVAMCGIKANAGEVNYKVIPRPQSVELQKGAFTLNAKVKISYPKGDADMARNAQFLKD